MSVGIRDLTKPVIDLIELYSGAPRFRRGEFHCVIETQSLPDLCLPTGRIVVGDPGYIHWEQPLEVEVRPGTYPADMAIRVDREGDVVNYEVASTRITFSNTIVSKWRLATTSEEDADALGPLEHIGCSPDRSGILCFADESGPKIAAEQYDRAGSSLYRTFLDVRDGNGPFVDLVLDDQSGSNMIQTFPGDGCGPSSMFWGLNRRNNPVCLVCDFGCLSEYMSEEVEVGRVYDLVKTRQTVKTPASDIEVEIQKITNKRKLFVRISGPRLIEVEFEVRSSRGKALRGLRSTGTDHANEIVWETEYAKDIPSNAVFFLSYLDRVEPYLQEG